MENDFFTVIDEETGVNQGRINFSYEDIGGNEGISAKPVAIQIESHSSNGKQIIKGPIMNIGRQQLAELGALLLALAGTEDVDFSGAEALLDGFSLKGKAAATALANALEE